MPDQDGADHGRVYRKGSEERMGPGAGDGKHSAAGTKDGGGGSSLPQELLGKSCSLNAGALGSAVDEVGGIIIVPKT